MKTKLPLVLLFTFPATYSYLLLITLPHGVVTKTQSNPWSSAWHHIDRHTLTHSVGELADGFIYFPFFPGWSPVYGSVRLLLGQKTKNAWRTERKNFYNTTQREKKWCTTCVLALEEWVVSKRTRAGCVKVSRWCRWFVLFPFPVVFSLLAVTQTSIPEVTSSPETMPHNFIIHFHRAERQFNQVRAFLGDLQVVVFKKKKKKKQPKRNADTELLLTKFGSVTPKFNFLVN